MGRKKCKGVEGLKGPGYMVGLPNPRSVSKEEFQRRSDELKKTNEKIRKDWEAKQKGSKK